MSVAPVFVEYASQASAGVLDARCVRAAKPMLVTAVFSGLCVGVCFLSLANPGAISSAIHVVIFGITIAAAVRSGQAMRFPGESLPKYVVLDFLALVGLFGIAAAPLFLERANEGGESVRTMLAGALGACYLLLALTTVRHLFLHSQMFKWLRQHQRYGLARSFLILGWFKFVYESLWLACCAATLLLLATDTQFSGPNADAAIFFAFGALFGAMGFGLIWVWMIIAHAMLVRVSIRSSVEMASYLGAPVDPR